MDAMNRLFYGNIYFLDSIWNSFVISNQYTQLLSEYIPQNFSDNWKKAQKSPKVIHFQSNPKPWNDPKIIKADLFWSIARKTPYYERLIANITPPQIQNIISPQSQERKLVKFFKRILPKWMHPFARKVKRMLGW